jgi:formylglycine-generating enzyme required for sulfatase activity
MTINFLALQTLYNEQMNMLLSSTGLTTKCLLNYGVTKKDLCPNCVYDPNLKKSANKYKTGGPISFVDGRICPYCNGVGYRGQIKVEEIYCSILWNYKDWVIKPINVESAAGMMQTISDISLLSKFKKCKDLTVVLSSNNANPLFKLSEEPNPAGLGDNNYLIINWERIGTSSILESMVERPLVGANIVNYAYSSGVLLPVGTSGGPSAYGTYDQNGNAEEWTGDKQPRLRNVKIRVAGGSVISNSQALYKGSINNVLGSSKSPYRGFRVVSLTNPYDLDNYVVVGDRMNEYDPDTGFGNVSYEYCINKFETTILEWCNFVNSIASYASASGVPTDSDTYGVINNTFLSQVNHTEPSGFPGNYEFVPISGNENKPITDIDWLDTLRFCNWLNNGQPSGFQTVNNDGMTPNTLTTEGGSYSINGDISNTIFYSPSPTGEYRLPRMNEWYKAAFYKSGDRATTSCGRLIDGYWNYATQNDGVPTPAQT